LKQTKSAIESLQTELHVDGMIDYQLIDMQVLSWNFGNSINLNILKALSEKHKSDREKCSQLAESIDIDKIGEYNCKTVLKILSNAPHSGATSLRYRALAKYLIERYV
jgi:hypothetical protein